MGWNRFREDCLVHRADLASPVERPGLIILLSLAHRDMSFLRAIAPAQLHRKKIQRPKYLHQQAFPYILQPFRLDHL